MWISVVNELVISKRIGVRCFGKPNYFVYSFGINPMHMFIICHLLAGMLESLKIIPIPILTCNSCQQSRGSCPTHNSNIKNRANPTPQFDSRLDWKIAARRFEPETNSSRTRQAQRVRRKFKLKIYTNIESWLPCLLV